MKRFWKKAAAEPGEDGWRIELDGRPVRTPARALLLLPTQALATAVTAEWDNAGEAIDSRTMPLTGLANAAIDRVATNAAAFAESLSRYAATDLLCYRATGPSKLIARQAELWDPLLQWARRRYDVEFAVTEEVAPVDQSPETLRRLGHAVFTLQPFELAAMSPLVTVGGSLVAALAICERALSPDQVWEAVSLDERWQLEQWGSDREAETAVASRHADFGAGARFLELIRA